MKIKTANNRKLRAQRRRAAFNKKIKPWTRRVAKILARSLGCESRPWFSITVDPAVIKL